MAEEEILEVKEEEETEVEETEVDDSKKEKLELDFNMDAVERLTKEVEFTDSEYKKVVGNFLLKKFEEDEPLKKAYFERKVTLDEVWNSIVDAARKKAEGANSCCMADEEVFGLAIHFVQDGKVEVAKKETYVLSKESKESLKERAEKEFVEEQKRKLEEAERKRIEKEERAKEKAIAKEKKHLEESGQLNLFDLMEEENE